MIANGVLHPAGDLTGEQLVRISDASQTFEVYPHISRLYGKRAIAYLNRDEADEVIADIEIWEADLYQASIAEVTS